MTDPIRSTDRQSLRENAVCMAVQIRNGNDYGMDPNDIADTIMALVDQMNALERSSGGARAALNELHQIDREIFSPEASDNASNCPKCGQLNISVPRLGMHHVCPTSEPSEIPAWSDCANAHGKANPLTALERFVLDQEPAGIEQERKFREGLAAVLAEARRAPEPVAKPGEDFTLKQIAEFCGFLSAQIPELHNIHPDRLWTAFGKYLEASLPSAPTKAEKP